ncbi:Hsp70 family protein [Saccharothrix australiensis]|uniref:Hsp70 protein n=1 Tax=Saccharothrix australiensis TaxID=2072 RepID=A0A495VU43_9PSEU|nr:Hsp70 family protein [Saccharothrix australiensis]RKT52390.1 Hsp70 protein [Saccharothrix australiensis]
MPYVLGVDVGTTRTAAAVCRLDGAGRAEPELVGLGGPGGGVASSLRLTADGSFAVGEPGDPRWTAVGFARRVGDGVPVVLGSEPCAAEELTALMVLWVAGQVAEREGEPAARIVLAHPPGWGPHAKGLVRRALRAVGLEDVVLLAEPLAAAANHSFGRGPVGVFSLGSHAFSAAVVRPFELVAWADGVDQAAGADFDDLVFEHVRAALGRAFGELDAEDPRTRALRGRLRRDCEAAKRLLSGTFETAVPVHLPSGLVEVPLDRARFEELIRPSVEQAVSVFERVVRGAALEATVLVGGSARIPLISSLLPGRVVFEAAPESSAVKGAAVAGRQLLLGPDEPEPIETSVLVRDDDPLLRFPVGGAPAPDNDCTAPPPRPPIEVTPLELPERRSVKRVVRGLVSAGRSRDRKPEDGR